MGVSAYDHRPQQQRSSAVAVMSAHIPEQLVYPPPEAAKPPLMTFMSRARILAASNGSLKSTDTDRHCTSNSLMEPFYCDPLAAPSSFADVAPIHHNPPSTTIPSAKFRQEPIYASLSETLSSCHTLDSLGGRLAVDDEPSLRVERKDVVQLQEEEEDDDDEGSATESAGDDFEFHNIRTSRQTLITSSSSSSNDAPPTSSEAIFGLEDLRPRSRVARSATYRILCNGLDVKCTGKHDKDAAATAAAAIAATSESKHGVVTCVTIRVNPLL